MRDYLLYQQGQWLDFLKRIARSAIRANDFREDIDCDQFAFDLYSLLLGYNYYHILLNDHASKMRQEQALEQLLNAYR